MFSRRPDRPREEPRHSTMPRSTELIPVVPSDQPPGVWGPSHQASPTSLAGPGDATVIAATDHVEGTLRSGQGVLVLGSFAGTLESESWIRIGEGARVRADLVAEEIVVAGLVEGTLIARSRLEIGPGGHVRGDIGAPRVLLHEGGIIDGTLHMTMTEARRPAIARGQVVPPPAPMAQPAPEAATTPVPGAVSVRGPSVGALSPRSRGATPVPVDASAAPAPAAPRPPAETSTGR